jgi:hypothetical protein
MDATASAPATAPRYLLPLNFPLNNKPDDSMNTIAAAPENTKKKIATMNSRRIINCAPFVTWNEI